MGLGLASFVGRASLFFLRAPLFCLHYMSLSLCHVCDPRIAAIAMLPRGECALLCFDVLAAVDGAVHPVPLRPPTNTLSLEDLRNRVVMPAFTLLFGGNLHGV